MGEALGFEIRVFDFGGKDEMAVTVGEEVLEIRRWEAIAIVVARLLLFCDDVLWCECVSGLRLGVLLSSSRGMRFCISDLARHYWWDFTLCS